VRLRAKRKALARGDIGKRSIRSARGFTVERTTAPGSGSGHRSSVSASPRRLGSSPARRVGFRRHGPSPVRHAELVSASIPVLTPPLIEVRWPDGAVSTIKPDQLTKGVVTIARGLTEQGEQRLKLEPAQVSAKSRSTNRKSAPGSTTECQFCAQQPNRIKRVRDCSARE
jgi:hypothetical protein